MGVEQPLLDMPEVLWKAYIDFEIAEEESDKARALYERLLERTSHVKVCLLLSISFKRCCEFRKFDLDIEIAIIMKR